MIKMSDPGIDLGECRDDAVSIQIDNIAFQPSSIRRCRYFKVVTSRRQQKCNSSNDESNNQ